MPLLRVTQREAAILAAIQKYQKQRGYSPTIREIARMVGINSTSLTRFYLNKLERNGKITRERNTARTIVLIEEEAK